MPPVARAASPCMDQSSGGQAGGDRLRLPLQGPSGGGQARGNRLGLPLHGPSGGGQAGGDRLGLGWVFMESPARLTLGEVAGGPEG